MDTKTQVVSALARRTGLTAQQAAAFVDALGDIAREELAAGREMRLHDIGTLRVRTLPARQTRHPRTGAVLSVGATHSVAFKPTLGLRHTLNPKTS